MSDTYTLHEYNPTFDAGLAEMWNESDDQWPGTFTRGVPFDEERITEWMARVAAIVKFIAVRNRDGKVVGYGDLWEDLARPRSAYIALLNVHPKHQGRGLARQMCTRMVDWAVAHGYDRLTIGTWPANLKAMPLYKKVGFFWEPGTSVHMENYVPAVRLQPAARAYFARHDWYHTYRRDLAQVEDDLRHPKTGGQKVYILRWEAEGDLLEAVFDRNAQALTGLETNTFAAYARTNSSEPAQGLSYPVEWELTNKTNQPLPVSLMASGEPGIQLEHRTTFTLAPGETRLLEARFQVALDAPAYDTQNAKKPTPRLKTLLVVGGEVVEFGTGVRYRPAIEFSLGPSRVLLQPGRQRTVQVQLRSRVDRPIRGTVMLSPEPGLETAWQRQAFEISPLGFAGFPLALTPQQGGEVPLTVRASFEIAGEPTGETTGEPTGETTTPPKRFPLVVVPPGGVAAAQDDDHLWIENDFFRLEIARKAGRATLHSTALNRDILALQEELGTPFVPWDLEQKPYDLRLVHGPHIITAVARAASGRFPGLTVTREIAVTAAPLLTIRHRVTNDGSQPHTFHVRPFVENHLFEEMEITVPFRDRLATGHGSQFTTAHDDLPEDPAELSEHWLALSENGFVSGVLFPERTEKLLGEWGQLYFVGPKNTLAPQETLTTEPLYVYAGPGDWATIRGCWQRLFAPASAPRTPEPVVSFGFEAPCLGTLNGTLETRLRITNARQVELDGSLTVQPPPGWTTDPRVYPFAELTRANPFTVPITFTGPPEGAGPRTGRLRLSTSLFDETRPFTLLRLGDEAQKVCLTLETRGDQEVWRLANGLAEWVVAPGFHGGVIEWREAGGPNQLLTTFPEEGEHAWMKPFFGGLRPTLFLPIGFQGWPGKLHAEQFTAAPLQAPGADGLPWQGLRLRAELTDESFKGLHVELDTLTLPGSPVLKFVYRLINQTAAYRDAEAGLMAFFQLDGTHENSTLHSRHMHRKRTPHMAWTVVEDWAAVENPETGRAAVIVVGGGTGQVQFLDWGEAGGHLYRFQITQVPPLGTHETVTYLALAPSLEEAKGYQALRHLSLGPATPNRR